MAQIIVRAKLEATGFVTVVTAGQWTLTELLRHITGDEDTRGLGCYKEDDTEVESGWQASVQNLRSTTLYVKNRASRIPVWTWNIQ
jgi:hypothetical protein